KMSTEIPLYCSLLLSVLQLRLQQRRTREQLVDQGIMPPLKSPAAFHGQIRSLERARTENFLKHKIRSRPERAELVRMHILQETGAEPSLQATQMKLKRARLADNLNEKIAQRPGPMELVEKNILPVDSNLKQAIIVGQVNYPKVLDEDSSDALSPEQPASQESQSSVPSPGENKAPETPSPAAAIPVATQATTDFMKVISTNEQHATRPAVTLAQPLTTAVPSKPGPTLVKQSQQKPLSEKSRSKKGKEPKSRVKKLKYHQYVPPDQKQEASEAPMDSSYARLLQQQQLFLQLQILSQQQQHYNYQTILPAPLKPVAEGQSSSASSLPASIVVSLPTASPPPPLPPAPTRPHNSLSNRKPGVLPANLEEMKVAELKLELKLRGLPVSGTKTDLIERLKPFQDTPTTSAPSTTPSSAALTTLTTVPMEVSTTTTTPAIVLPAQQGAPENMSSTPPVSPIPNESSSIMSEAQMGPLSSPIPTFHIPEEKDRRLHEKERQIEELMRKLEQEQKLVEELKMQLEVEKRGLGSGSTDSASVPPQLTSVPAINSVPTVLNANVPTATSQQMDDLFDILIESGEITPFIQQDPPASINKTLPVTANITTLPMSTALCRPPPQIQLAPPPTLSPTMDPNLPSLSSLATDNQLEAFLEKTLTETPPASDPRTQGLMEELQAQLMDQQPYSPMDTSDLSFCDSSSPPSSLQMGLSDPALDNMEWLDLTMPPGPAGPLTPLGIPTDFLDSHDLQLHWD
uniref:Myocardin related transcription factor Ba n=1 Tax=Sphaeramia orbicularis TaxID=375764 RepID=A0A673B6U1_9TELE